MFPSALTGLAGEGTLRMIVTRLRASRLLACAAVLALAPSGAFGQKEAATARELYARGHLELARNDYAAAVARWEEALGLDPDLWEAQYQIGEALVAWGRSAEAVPRFREVLRLRPGDPRATSSLERAERLAAQAPPTERGPAPAAEPARKPDPPAAGGGAEGDDRWRKLVESANTRVKDRSAGRGAYVLESAPSPEPQASDGAPGEADTPPTGSVLDQMRVKAEAFAPRLLRLSGEADAVDGHYASYLSSCYSRRPSAPAPPRASAQGREWFVVFSDGAALAWQSDWSWEAEMTSADAEYCQALWRDIQSRAEAIRGGVEEIEADAVAMEVWPGIVRELRTRHRLSWR